MEEIEAVNSSSKAEGSYIHDLVEWASPHLYLCQVGRRVDTFQDMVADKSQDTVAGNFQDSLTGRLLVLEMRAPKQALSRIDHSYKRKTHAFRQSPGKRQSQKGVALGGGQDLDCL
eukprot:949020-Pelagomonas_calceolata.AAC.1